MQNNSTVDNAKQPGKTKKRAYILLATLVLSASTLIFGNIYLTAYHFAKLQQNLRERIEFAGINEEIIDDVKYQSLIQDRTTDLKRVLEVWILLKENRIEKASRKAINTSFPRVSKTQSLQENFQAMKQKDLNAQQQGALRSKALENCEGVLLELTQPKMSKTSLFVYNKGRSLLSTLGFKHPAL